MKKILAITVCSVLLAPVWAAQSQIKSLFPTNNIQLPTILSTKFVEHTRPQSYPVKVGGYGGNMRIGRLIYSNDPAHLSALTVSREPTSGLCYLENENAKMFEGNNVIKFNCISTDPTHDDIYWNANLGEVNGGYSPENDTLYATETVTKMFKNWYNISPVVDDKGLHKPIPIRLHLNSDNAYADEDSIDIGNGGRIFYPLTSLPVISYLIGQVFTNQHSNLNWYDSQSGGISIAFSCMTAMAAEFYATHKNTWQVGADVIKSGQALHYMDVPSKNCKEEVASFCSIDTLAKYKPRTRNYAAGGLFNRAFYLLATTTGWDTHKAYDIFVQANRYHWKSDVTFHQGACDVVTSAKELGYDTMSVMIAFSGVGIDTRDC